MALSAKEFRDIERRKMRLQADIAARRNSLMTMGNASIVPRPDDLPSKFDKAVADANNAAALKYLENSGNEFGPQSLNTLAAKGLIMDPFNSLNLYPQVTSSPFTKALNTRAANLTADDQYRVGLSSGPFTPSKNRTSGRGYSEGAIASLYEDQAAAQAAAQVATAHALTHQGRQRTRARARLSEARSTACRDAVQLASSS